MYTKSLLFAALGIFTFQCSLVQRYDQTNMFLLLGEYHSKYISLQSSPGHVRSRETFRPITREHKYLMDYNS